MLADIESVKENYYIGSLPGIVDGRELRRYLQQFGDVIHLEVIKDTNTGKCKGFAFLSIVLSVTEAEFLGYRHKYSGRTIFVRPKLEGNDLKAHKADFQLKRLYISTTSKKLTDQDIATYFSSFGIVDLAYFVKNHDKTRDKVRFGYISFRDEQSVEMVLQNSRHIIHGQEVKCDYFKSKQARQEEGPRNLPSQYKVPKGINSVIGKSIFNHQRSLLRQRTTETYPSQEDGIKFSFSGHKDDISTDFMRITQIIQHRHDNCNIRLNLRRPQEPQPQ